MPLLSELGKLGRAVHFRSTSSCPHDEDTWHAELSLEGFKSFCIDFYDHCLEPLVAQDRVLSRRKKELREETEKLKREGKRRSTEVKSSTESLTSSGSVTDQEEEFHEGITKSELLVICLKLLQQRVHQSRFEAFTCSIASSGTSFAPFAHLPPSATPPLHHCSTAGVPSEPPVSLPSSTSACPCQSLPINIEWIPIALAVVLECVGEAFGSALNRRFLPKLPEALEVRLHSSSSSSSLVITECEEITNLLSIVAQELHGQPSIIGDEDTIWRGLITRWNAFGQRHYLGKGKYFLAPPPSTTFPVAAAVPKTSVPPPVSEVPKESPPRPPLNIHSHHQELRKSRPDNQPRRPSLPAQSSPPPQHSVFRPSPQLRGRLFMTMKTSPRRLASELSWSLPQASQGTEFWSYSHDFTAEDVLIAALLQPEAHSPKFHYFQSSDSTAEEEDTGAGVRPPRRRRRHSRETTRPPVQLRTVQEEPIASFHTLIASPQREIKKLFFRFCERFQCENWEVASLISTNPLQYRTLEEIDSKEGKYSGRPRSRSLPHPSSPGPTTPSSRSSGSAAKTRARNQLLSGDPRVLNQLRLREKMIQELLALSIQSLNVPPPTPLLRCIPVPVNLNGSFVTFCRELYRCIRGYDQFAPQPQLKEVIPPPVPARPHSPVAPLDQAMRHPIAGGGQLASLVFTNPGSQPFELPTVSEDDMSEDEFVRLAQELASLFIDNRYSSDALMNRLHAPLPAPLALVLWSLVPSYATDRGLMFVPMLPGCCEGGTELESTSLARGFGEEEEDDDYMEESEEAETRRLERKEALIHREKQSSRSQSMDDLLEGLGDYESLLHRKLTKLSLRSVGVPFVDIASSRRITLSPESQQQDIHSLSLLPTIFFYTLRSSSVWLSAPCKVPMESVALASLLPDIQLVDQPPATDAAEALESFPGDAIANFQYAAPIPDVTTLRTLFSSKENYQGLTAAKPVVPTRVPGVPAGQSPPQAASVRIARPISPKEEQQMRRRNSLLQISTFSPPFFTPIR